MAAPNRDCSERPLTGQFLLTCWLLIGLFALFGCEAPSSATQLRLGHSLDTQHPVHLAMVHMQARLTELSGGTLELAIYPNSQLGNERELIELLQIGSLAMTKVSASPLEGFVPSMGLFNIPYLFDNKVHFFRFLDSDLGQALLLETEKVGLRGLTYYDAGARSFYTNDRPVKSPSDLEGLKIRVQESATAMSMVSALGASPTPIAWGELYTALQQGVVDGAENNPPSYHLSRHFEVSRYYSLDEHTAVPDVLLISQFVWERLSTQEQNWLQQAADESSKLQRALWSQAELDALNVVQQHGVTIIYPDKKAFRARVVNMQQDLIQGPLGSYIQQARSMRSTESKRVVTR